MKRPLTRKETAPLNVAAKALRQGQFQPKVEADPKTYRRTQKHRADEADDLLPEDGAENAELNGD